MKPEISLSLKQDAVTGFSYSFAKSLLDALKQLRKNDKVYENGEEAFKNSKTSGVLTPLAKTILNYLDDQTKMGSLPYSIKDLDRVITGSEEFLSIFEKDQKLSQDPADVFSRIEYQRDGLWEQEKNLLMDVLKRNANDKAKAADELGTSEGVLSSKIEEYKIIIVTSN